MLREGAMSTQFKDKVAVVTGAGSGIGRAAAQEFGVRGAAVAVVDRREPAARETAASIARGGGTAEPYAADVSVRGEVDACVAAIVQRFGGIDILVNNAGIQRYGTAVTTSDEVWDEVMAVNLRSAFLMSRAAIPHIIERGGGSVITVGSVQSVGAVGNSAAYVTSKHGLLGLARSIALDFALQGIRSHCVCPGAIDTPMLRWSASLAKDPREVIAACERLHLFRRLGKPSEIAKVIAFLASDESSFMTGHPILVEGGALTPVGGAAFYEGGTGAGAE